METKQENILDYQLIFNYPFGSWIVKDKEDKLLGQFTELNDARLFIAAKINGVIVIGEREKVPANEGELVTFLSKKVVELPAKLGELLGKDKLD